MNKSYKEWEKAEMDSSLQLVNKLSDRIQKGERIDLLELVPELRIGKGQLYTFWTVPGSPDALRNFPECDLRNLESIYASNEGKILVPIELHESRSEFEYTYGMSIETLTKHLKENKQCLRPTLIGGPWHFKRKGLYKGLIAACQEIYEGCYPPSVHSRTMTLFWLSRIQTIGDRENITPNDEYWLDRVLESYPEYDPDLSSRYHKMAEILFRVDDTRASLNQISRMHRTKPRDLLDETSGKIMNLTIFGFNNHVRLSLRLARSFRDPELGRSMLYSYHHYLITPFTTGLGGFQNLDLFDIENMAFLRLFPLKSKELEEIQTAVLQSPAATSLLLQEPGRCRINIFRGGSVHKRDLDAMIKLSGKYPNIGKHLAGYRQKLHSGDLKGASKSAKRFSEILIGQYNAEIEEWKKREKRSNIVKGVLNYGASFVVWPTVLLSNLPIEWKSAVIVAIEMTKRALYRKIGALDTKKIVESLWRVKNWPFAQKGVPYLLWTKESART